MTRITTRGAGTTGPPELVLRCPACGGDVKLPKAEIFAGRRVGCLHCGEESWLDREDGPEGPGEWVLAPPSLEDTA